jgi:hypothetical protein
MACVCVLVTALFTSRAIWPAPRAPLAIKLELGYSCVCRLLDEVAACIWDQLRGHSCMGCGLRTDCVLFFSEFPGPDGIASACIVDALHRLLRPAACMHALALAAGHCNFHVSGRSTGRPRPAQPLTFWLPQLRLRRTCTISSVGFATSLRHADDLYLTSLSFHLNLHSSHGTNVNYSLCLFRIIGQFHFFNLKFDHSS